MVEGICQVMDGRHMAEYIHAPHLPQMQAIILAGSQQQVLLVVLDDIKTL